MHHRRFRINFCFSLKRENTHACKLCRDKAPYVNAKEAAKELGTGLHPLQDIIAHGDYGKNDDGFIWTTHNANSPAKYNIWGEDPSNYPDDVTLDAVGDPFGIPQGNAMKSIPREIAADFSRKGLRDYAIFQKGNKRFSLVEFRTKGYIIRFERFLLSNGDKKCKCWFLF